MSKPQELQHLDTVFQSNGFPVHLVKKALTPSSKAPCASTEHCTPPYIWGLSEKLEKICAPLNICSVFTTSWTLRQTLINVKSRIPDNKKKSIVHQVPCKDCDSVYMGESKETLKVWLAEHKCAVTESDPNNGIAVHVRSREGAQHWLGNASVLKSVQGYWERTTWWQSRSGDAICPWTWIMASTFPLFGTPS